MSERDSEQIIRTFGNDDLAMQGQIGIQEANNSQSRPRRSVQQQGLSMRRPGRNTPNPFRCSACGNTQLRAFATMYAQGTSTAVTMKGLIFKHDYRKTWRQTEIARICAPPRKKRYWPAVLLLIVAALGTFAVYSDFLGALASTRVMQVSFVMGWLGVSLAAYHFYWNLRHYPESMNAYGRLLYCQRCGTVTRV